MNLEKSKWIGDYHPESFKHFSAVKVDGVEIRDEKDGTNENIPIAHLY